jgi:D-beta-D-heptose 7-phosphate kinase/D-beta-D-heptose 1-phosphate adenosyltransferase
MIIGFTNGCYDILHVGHIKLFKYLKSKCDYVTIGIDSDLRVKSLKGDTRPFNNQEDRKFMLESLEAVDNALIFNSEEELVEMVKNLSPDLMVVGVEYKEKRVVGSEHAKKLEFFEKIDGYSTTKILQSNSNRR